MNKILLVLAILLSGIASAQTETPQLWEASICGGGPSNPRHIDLNGLDYVLVDGYRAEIEAAFPGIICLSSNGNVNRNWRSYFTNYRGGTIQDRTSQNHHRISFPNGVVIERRTSGRYNVRVTLRGLQSRYNASATNNARDAWNYALRN